MSRIRISLYFEPRDVWIGAYRGADAIFLCLIPMIVFRWWQRSQPSPGPLRLRRIRWGRLHAYLEPRNVWIGAYIARPALYVQPLPCLVLRWDRQRPVEVVQVGRPLADGDHVLLRTHREFR